MCRLLVVAAYQIFDCYVVKHVHCALSHSLIDLGSMLSLSQVLLALLWVVSLD